MRTCSASWPACSSARWAAAPASAPACLCASRLCASRRCAGRLCRRLLPAAAAPAAAAGTAPGLGDGGTAGCSRPGGLRSTTISAITAASSPTAPITREIVLLMAHPNPARRPRHQGVMPGGNPAARGHARHLRPRGRPVAQLTQNGASRHDAPAPGQPGWTTRRPFRPGHPAHPARTVRPGRLSPTWHTQATQPGRRSQLTGLTQPAQAGADPAGRRTGPASLNRAAQSGRPSLDHPTDPARPHPARSGTIRSGRVLATWSTRRSYRPECSRPFVESTRT